MAQLNKLSIIIQIAFVIFIVNMIPNNAQNSTTNTTNTTSPTNTTNTTSPTNTTNSTSPTNTTNSTIPTPPIDYTCDYMNAIVHYLNHYSSENLITFNQKTNCGVLNEKFSNLDFKGNTAQLMEDLKKVVFAVINPFLFNTVDMSNVSFSDYVYNVTAEYANVISKFEVKSDDDINMKFYLDDLVDDFIQPGTGLINGVTEMKDSIGDFLIDSINLSGFGQYEKDYGHEKSTLEDFFDGSEDFFDGSIFDLGMFGNESSSNNFLDKLKGTFNPEDGENDSWNPFKDIIQGASNITSNLIDFVNPFNDNDNDGIEYSSNSTSPQ